jgi:hypothetical protein
VWEQDEQEGKVKAKPNGSEWSILLRKSNWRRCSILVETDQESDGSASIRQKVGEIY